MPRSIARRAFSTFVLLLAIVSLPGIVSAQDQTIRRITNTPPEGINLNPTISGDGRRIAFESTEDITNSGGENYFRTLRADVSTNVPTFIQLAISRSPVPAVSQDGSRIAFASKDNPLGSNPDGNSEIFYYDGSTLRQITNTTPDDATRRAAQGCFTPSITDDGLTAVFVCNRNLTGENPPNFSEVYAYEIARGANVQITRPAQRVGQLNYFSALSPKISGNGTRIVFLGTVFSEVNGLFLFDRQNSSVRLISTSSVSVPFSPGRVISDDGTRVVFALSNSEDNSGVFLYDDRDRTARPITSIGARANDVPLHATISGDGRTLAYATRGSSSGTNSRNRGVNVYVYDSFTQQTTKITNAPDFPSGTDLTALEIITSLNDTGTLLAFNFPRILTDTVANPVFAANSEIYLAALTRQESTNDLRVVNGASFGLEPAATKAVAPDSIAVATSPTAQLARTTERAERLADGTYPRTVGGTTVTVNNRQAQIIFVSPDRVDFIVPVETETGTAQVSIRNSDGFETRGTVQVLRAAPGVFTESGDGQGEAIAIDAANGRRSPFDPVDEQGNARTIIISTTGVRNASTVTVTINSQAQQVARVERARDEQGREIPGLDLIYVTLSSALRGVGQVPVVVRADNRDSNPTTLTFTGTREAASVELTPTSATTNIGGTVRFTAIVRDAQGNVITGAPVTFRSSNEVVATIDGNGLATGRSAGTTQITATSGNITSQPATLNVISGALPRVPTAGEVVINEALVSFSTSTTQPRADFVELFNKTNETLDISGLVVSFRPGGSTTTPRTVTLPGTPGGNTTQIQPNGYFLIANGVNTFDVAADFNADAGATNNFDLNNTTGGIRIDIGSTKLDGLTYQGGTAAPPAAFIAFGEGAIFTFTSGSLNDLVRTPNGQDTNDNAADFRRNSVTANVTPKASNSADSQPASVTISPASANAIIGDTVQFTAVVRNSDGEIIPNAPVTFNSSNTTVATIDQNGLATARATGTTQITATSGTVTSDPATLTVTTNTPTPASVTITPATATTNIGGTVQFTATVRDADGNIIPNAPVTFRSSNEAVATIDQNGLATGRSVGTTQITATSGNITSQPATLTVTSSNQTSRVPVAGEVVINEALVSFATSTTQARADFVELFNKTNETLDLSGLIISFRPGGSTTTARTVQLPGASGSGTTLIQPNAYFLVVNGASTFDVTADFNANADNSNAFELNNTTGGIRIDIGAVKLDGLTYQGGTAAPPAAFLEFGEGAIFTFTSGSTNDLIRVPNGADTNNNAADFRRNGTTANVSPKVSNPNAAQQPASVTISPTTTNARVGETVQFTATVRDADGAIIPNAAVTFNSSNTTVATIDANGLATARAAGTTQITATSGTVTSDPATLTVTSGNPTPASVTISPTTATTSVGGTVQFTATVRDQQGNIIPNATVTFASSNETVATVDQNGLATGRSAGTTQITATSGGVTSQPATLTVTSSNPTSRVPVAGEVVINEAVVAFASSTSQTRTDFLELLNKTNATLDISGLTISFRIGGSSNMPRVVMLPGTIGSGTILIQPNGYFLIANGAQTFGATADFDASAQQLDFNGTTGGIKIEAGTVKLDGITYQGGTAAPNQTFIDYGEGTIFTFTGASLNDLIRVPNGADTNNNAADFRLNSNNANVTPKAANPTP